MAYLLGQVVAASYTCTDGGSGVASCLGTVANGVNINTSSVGAKSFTVNAQDNVGNTGNADGTDYHLHFEVHPVPFLFLGEDGAVDPTEYLDHWRRLQEIRLRPAVGGGPPLASKSGPPPGAVARLALHHRYGSPQRPAIADRGRATPTV